MIEIDYIGGYCPVQSEGWINGKPFYFRARYERWSLGIGGDPIIDPEWYAEVEYPGEMFAAGYMEEDEALACIHKAAAMYLEQTTGLPNGASE